MSTYRYCPLCASDLTSRPRNDDPERSALVCSDEECDFVHYDNPTPVVAALVEAPDEVVILVRNHGWPDTWFGLVSGFLERGESPHEGVLREVEEELGVTGEIVAPIGQYAFEQFNQVILAYHVVVETADVTPGGDVAEFKRVPADKLRPWPIGTGHAVSDWLRRRFGRVDPR